MSCCDLRAVTVRQPWAWAIARGLKVIENRTKPQPYRGRLLIHAGAAWSVRGATDIRIREAWWTANGGAPDGDRLPQLPDPQKVSGTLVHPSVRTGPPAAAIELGALVAVCELVDCHPAQRCCEPWGEDSYVEAGGRRRTDIWHLVLEDIQPIDPPVPCVGHLGLWKPPAEVVRLLPEFAR